jgi:hypothetical protein
MNMRTAYFAHSKRKYNTADEAAELAFIQKHFKGEVICPNNNLGELGGIEPYLKVIQSTICVYVSEYFGMIGRGVYDECHFALTNGINVVAVRKDIKGKFFVQIVRDVVEINENDFIRFGLLITK